MSIHFSNFAVHKETSLTLNGGKTNETDIKTHP